MRKINVIKGDILFQWKYGFYLLYFLVILIYMVLFSFFSGDIKNTIVSICVYSDPAAMGMFFMGALVLLEKSQRVIHSIAISPVTSKEYILGKIASFVFISEIVGVILMTQGQTKHFILCMLGIMLGSVLFTLCGIIVGTRVGSLNQYILGTLPFELLGFVPVIAYRLGFMRNQLWMLIHPGCSIMELIEGNLTLAVPALCSSLVWIFTLFVCADLSVRKMFRDNGGVKL